VTLLRKLSYVFLLGVVSCSDARCSSNLNYGSGAIKCYSMGTVVYEGTSSGRVEYNEEDKWHFKDAFTGKYVRVDAECVIIN
jgi:hypothetical protein